MKKIKSAKTNSGKWYDLDPGVEVMTDSGTAICKRFYFNGFRDTKIIIISDGHHIQCTHNHQLMIGESWKRSDEIEVGDVFNTGAIVIDIFDGGVQPTMDMEVPIHHYYILPNGIKSHNSAFILGQASPSIEPLASNYFVKNLAKGKFTYKNKSLEKLLKEKGYNTKETWKSILEHGGSVQHLDFLTEHEKAVYKTFGEISQKSVIIHAAQRQKYIDQGQSLNLMIPANTSPKVINSLLIFAWENGVKGLYYQRSSNPAQELARNIMTCASCES